MAVGAQLSDGSVLRWRLRGVDLARTVAWRLVSLAALATVWEIVGQRTDPLLFPPFSKVAAAWVDLVVSGELPTGLALSLSAFVLGLALSLVVGITVGVAMGWFRKLEHVADVLFTLILVVPMVSLIPVMVIAFGLGLEVRVAAVFLFTVPVIGLNSYTGTKQADARLVEMARAYGARDVQLLLKVVLPAAVPGIMSGVRLGIGRAVVGMVTAEFLIVSVGIGLLIMQYSSRLLTANVYAAILSIVGLGMLASFIGQKIDTWVAGRHGRRRAFADRS